MTIKQKIWGIPLVTIVIFAVGMAILYLASSRTYTLHQRTGGIHHPYLDNIQILLHGRRFEHARLGDGHGGHRE